MQLEQGDFNRLVAIVQDLPEFRTEDRRWDLLDDVLAGSSRGQDVRGLLSLGGAPRAAAVRLVTRLATFGQDEPGREILGVLVNKLLDGYVGFGEEADFLRGLFDRYPLDVPVAPTQPIGAWQGGETPSDVQEKIIGENTLRDILLLELALVAQQSVVRIHTGQALGSGFLLAPDLLMTNNHVIASAAEAASSAFTFNYQLDIRRHEAPTQTVAALPDGLFYTNKSLDFTVVQLKEVPEGIAPLVLRPVRAERDSRVSIIQHPGGHYKKISMQNNFVQYADTRVVQYTTSTEPGSSGSPVFNEDFEVIAIHHAGGLLLEPSTSRRYLRNEGISMIAVLKDLQANALTIFDQVK